MKGQSTKMEEKVENIERSADTWVAGRERDSDETHDHVRPAMTEVTVEAPGGVWVDVPKGMIVAPGTYVDEHGVMRSNSDDSVVAWHRLGCQRRGLKPEELIKDSNNAPWCPECFHWDKQKCEEMRKIAHAKFDKNEKGTTENVGYEGEEEVRARLKGMFGA